MISRLGNLQDGFKTKVLLFLNLVLLFLAVLIMPQDVPGRAARYEQDAAKQAQLAAAQVQKAQDQVQTIQKQVDAATAAAQVAEQKKEILTALLPDPTWSALCPKSSPEVARLVGGIVERWSQVPGNKIGWEYKPSGFDNTVTLTAPSFGRLESSFIGVAKPGAVLHPETDYHYYFWCDS